MDAPDYQDKIDAVLSDGKYELLDQDPTKDYEKSFTKALWDLQRKGELPRELSKRLLPAYTSAPQMYHLPKIHKEGVLLRPIVSTIGSPCYNLAKELSWILSPLMGGTDSHIKNSVHFVQRIQDIKLDDKDLLVSFDVTSLFTCVPIDNAMKIVAMRREEDDDLEDRTTLSPESICYLTELCLRATYSTRQN